MNLNLNETWNGAPLSDVREFIQTQLKNGFTSVSSQTLNGKVILTFTKADGTTTTTSFTAADDSALDGFACDLRMRKLQSIYGSGSDVSFTYTYTQTLDGEEELGVTPTITFAVYTIDASNNPVKELYRTVQTSIGTKTVTIPSSVFKNVSGNVLIEGNVDVMWDGVKYPVPTRRIIISIAECSINFNQSFNLAKHIRGYAANATMNEVFVDYVGTNQAELLIYVDGVHRKTISEVATGTTTDVDFAMDAVDTNGATFLTTGIHTMQIVAKMDTGTVDENNQPLYIYSKSLLFDFYTGITGNHVGIQMNIDSPDIIASPSTNLTIQTEQYVNTTIKYAASSYNSSDDIYNDSTAVSVSKDNNVVNNLVIGNTEAFEYTFRDTQISNYVLTFAVSANNRKINVRVNKNASGVAVASGVNIDISAAGRNNLESESKRKVWTFTDNKGVSYTGTLSNFTYKSDGKIVIDGWDGQGLVFRGASQLDIPYKPFESFNATTGYYAEFNFKVDTVLDGDRYILSCLDSNNKGGFYLKAEEAGIITATGNKVSTPIAAGDTYNVGFMVKSYEGQNEGVPVTTTLLELFVNGVRSGVVVFSNGDSFSKDSTIVANGLGAIWSLYGMRVYNATLTPYAIYNNYLTTLLDGDEIVKRADENDVLNNAKTAVDHQKLLKKGKNVLIVEVGDGKEQCAQDSTDLLGKMLDECTGTSLETRYCATKDQFLNPSAVKKDNFLVKGLTYYNNGTLEDPYSFKCGPTLMQVQGTSSTYYSRKNYDIFFTGQKYSKAEGDKSKNAWTSKFDTTVGTSVTGANTTSPKYAMSSSDLPVPCLCLKADYSDSSNLHNTVLTKLVNDVWMNLGADYQTPPQHNNDTEFSEIRVGINGHPIDVFVQNGTEYIYIGKYNMNNEKKDSHHVFGFDGTTGNTSVGTALCIEFLENNRTATLFNADDNFDWKNCSDTVDEDGDPIPQLEFRYASGGGGDWNEADEIERSIAKRPFVWVKDVYDDWMNSYNEDLGEYTSTRFVKELTQYFNPKNLVSWYLYTEYFLAVDQRSKNMMLASWGATTDSGVWYFLPYDGDTALGVTNDGWLIIPWDADEETKNPKDNTQYAFMGHDSNLWKLVRFFLYDDTYTKNEEYGLKGCSMQEIAQVLRNEKITDTLFNKETINNALSASRDYWCDMLYNFDADTKYIAPLTWQSGRGSKSDFAQFIQGARDAHRDWLINKRFRLLDAKYAAGFFVSDEKNMKVSKDADVAAAMKVTSVNTAYVQLIGNTKVVAKKKLEGGVETTLDLTAHSFGSNDPFKLQGFSAVESIDFDTLSPYIYSDVVMPSTFTNLKTLIMNCPNNDGVMAEDSGAIVKSLPNLRKFIMKGYPDTTGILDLSNNIMLEHVEIDCEKLQSIIMPYSTFNLAYFNVGKLNDLVPWEVWDKINDYYYKKDKSSIFVGELDSRDSVYRIKNGVKDTSVAYSIGDKYFVYVSPKPMLIGPGRDCRIGCFGSNSTDRGQRNLIKILYAKVTTEYDKELALTDQSFITSYLFSNCSNLEYVNTRGWRFKISDINSVYQHTTYGSADMMLNISKLKSIDLSFIDTATGSVGAGGTNYQDYYINMKDTNTFPTTECLEYVKYGSDYFNIVLENKSDVGICKHSTLNAQTWEDLVEDLPDLTGLNIQDSYRTLHVGTSNIQNKQTLTSSCITRIEGKGWIIKE